MLLTYFSKSSDISGNVELLNNNDKV